MGADFPMLADHDRSVSKLYGVLNERTGLANRTTFVIDTQGNIVNITEDREAIDVSGALAACSRLKKK